MIFSASTGPPSQFIIRYGTLPTVGLLPAASARALRKYVFATSPCSSRRMARPCRQRARASADLSRQGFSLLLRNKPPIPLNQIVVRHEPLLGVRPPADAIRSLVLQGVVRRYRLVHKLDPREGQSQFASLFA